MATKDGKKSGGRAKGVPNKKKTLVEEIALKMGVNPIEVLLNIVKGDWQALGYESNVVTKFGAGGVPVELPVIELDHRLSAAKEVCQYMYPKRKAIEHVGADGERLETITVQIVDAKKH